MIDSFIPDPFTAAEVEEIRSHLAPDLMRLGQRIYRCKHTENLIVAGKRMGFCVIYHYFRDRGFDSTVAEIARLLPFLAKVDKVCEEADLSFNSLQSMRNTARLPTMFDVQEDEE